MMSASAATMMNNLSFAETERKVRREIPKVADYNTCKTTED
jgi:hypothetical protein